jgi:drug/metabolite transporter (DMT)-like permease
VLTWVVSAGVTAGLLACCVAVAVASGGPARAVLLGVAAGLGFAYTAVLMKRTVEELPGGARTLVGSWSLWAMVAAGLCSLFLLQNALHSGPLVAVQPALTVTDPVASTAYGVAMFGEDIRTGPWVLPELTGMALILYGSVLLSRHAPLREQARMAGARHHRGAGGPGGEGTRPAPR